MSFGLPYTTVYVQHPQLSCDLRNDQTGMSCMSVFPAHLIDQPRTMLIKPQEGVLCYRVAGEVFTELELRTRAQVAGWRRLDVCPKHPHGASEIK